MRGKKIYFLVVFSILVIISFFLFIKISKNRIPPYCYPKDEKVMQSLKEWQDLKFGMFIHWGTYSQWEIVESWSLCPEDLDFTNVRPSGSNYFEYVQEYENLKTTFNPEKFNPEKWAAAAENAGMKYVIFTTKHHDGFNMFDTKESNYKITDPGCPFSQNPRANITKEIFDAFRAKGLMTGAYYSLADWNHNDYWWDYYPPFNREINYSPEKYPEKWNNLNNFINNQLSELTSGEYGKINILWFDICIVSSKKQLEWERFSETARAQQPGIIMVARGQYDEYENYRTPEQRIPPEALDYPWETCMTMGNQWSYKSDEEYKPASIIIQFLVQIVSRGGNFLLNVGPGPDGELHPEAYQRLEEIGEWMDINSEGIYGTKPIKPYKETKLAFTSKDKTVYTFYLADEDETVIPSEIFIKSMKPASGENVYLLGYEQPLKWEKRNGGIVVEIPLSLQNSPPCKYVWCLKFNIK